jgi:hypothetical protein
MPRVTTIVTPPPPNETNPLIPGKPSPTTGDSERFYRTHARARACVCVCVCVLVTLSRVRR